MVLGMRVECVARLPVRFPLWIRSCVAFVFEHSQHKKKSGGCNGTKMSVALHAAHVTSSWLIPVGCVAPDVISQRQAKFLVHAHSYVTIDNVRIFVRIKHKMHHFLQARHLAFLQTRRISFLRLMRSTVCDRNCAVNLVFVTEFSSRGWIKLRARVETRTFLHNVRLVSVGAVGV